MPKKFTILDLFSGAGGLSTGFEMTKKFKIVAAVDNWQPAIETFLYNHPNISSDRVIHDDIEKIFPNNANKIENHKWLKDGDIDIIIGGPPCQGLSLAGKRLNNDPRNNLFKSFVSAIRLLKPKYFLMENVPGLLSMHNGKIHQAILEAFKKSNYTVQNLPFTILKSECYGVPQIRRRLFYLGVRDDISQLCTNWPPPITHKEFSLTEIKKRNEIEKKQILMELIDQEDSLLKEPICVKDAISDLPKLKSGDGADLMEYPKRKILSEYQISMRNWENCPRRDEKPMVFNHEPPNHTLEMIKKIEKAEQGKSVDPNYSDSKKWHPDYPGFTVKALGAGGGSTNRRAFHYDKNQPRGSTIRENARIQSFPDWYRFIGSKTDQMSLVGNAVPPLLAYRIAMSIYKNIESK